MPADARPRTYLRFSDGGLGMHSVKATAPAANAASWHKCLPHILRRLEIPTVGALMTASPWCALALPGATEKIRAATGDPALLVGDADTSASQRMLASAPLAAAADSVRTSVAIVGKAASAALRSSGGPGSAGWLQPPSAAPHYLSNPCFRIALRTRLDLDIPCQTGTCQHRRPDGTLCGTPLDLKGKHARACKTGGWIVRKHDAVVAELKKWSEKHGCYVDLEALIPQARGENGPHRPLPRPRPYLHRRYHCLGAEPGGPRQVLAQQ